MSFSRRKLLGVLSALPASLLPMSKVRSAEKDPYQDIVEYMLNDDVGKSIFNTFEKCLSFGDETTRRNALLLFTEAQEMLLRNIDETLDSEKFDDGQEWNEEMLREKAKIREAHIQRYIWSTKLCAYYPRTN